MADKAEKIAAARKKLKQYQSKQKQDSAIKNSANTARETTVPLSNVSCESQHPNIDNANQNMSAGAAPEACILQYPSNPGVTNYFNNNNDQIIPAFFAIEPQVSQAENVPIMEVSVNNINRMSDEIGQLIANASADLGPQNTILELESEKADLARSLNNQKLENDELRLRIRNYQSLVEELKNENDKLKLENSTKVTSELGPVQEQLQIQIQAVGVLVGEKADLTATVSKYQSLVKQKSTENDELQNRLKASRGTVQKLEKELEALKQSSNRFGELERSIKDQVNEYENEANKFRKLYEDLQEDSGELKQKLNVRNQEFQLIQKELEKTQSDLRLSKLRIDQLSSDDDMDFNMKIESLSQQNLIKAQQIKDLQEIIKQVGNERDQSNQQYQNYVLHLNKEVSNLADKIQELTNENNRLSLREDNLVRHIGELERQIQHQLTKQKTYAAQQQAFGENEQRVAIEMELKQLMEKVAVMEAERIEILHNESVEQLTQMYEAKLRQNEERLAELQLTVDRLQLEKPNVEKLMIELESGKVGASRAVAQNMDLKSQLEEMQKAFVQISNDKLELTEKLQTEMHLGKEMKATYGQMESELRSIREKLHYKDEEMIRLAHETTELNKQIYQQNQEIDRLRYYESRSNDGNVLQTELQRAQEQLHLLRQSESPKEHKCSHNYGSDEHKYDYDQEHAPNHDHDHKHELGHNSDHGQHDLRHEVDILRQEKDELVKVINFFQSRVKSYSGPGENIGHPIDQYDTVSEDVSGVSLPTHEAMEKLQERFKRTMLEVAELSDEKQRLEHLVMQLQGETETIGEYITLYQQQRRLLKQKDMERDLQLHQLANDREVMRLKLKELNYLVHQLVLEKGSKSSSSVSTPLTDAYHPNALPLVDLPTNMQEKSSNAIENEEHNTTKVHIRPTETAGRILSLLTDIKEANIPYGSGVQHCSCCSGRLETV
ncbi:golgin subfamily A member 2 isoform X2 [Malaya genurostris]|uniref:golgin subfamily A member 2 isoform X2 n=1 Tax=Malaya genurostris TaxID=325434 RepID=UPI0026F3BC95|nr:golgin subfamily A member 2 isoform X2 [Malaya genurostris]